MFFAIRIVSRKRDRLRTARPEGQIRLSSTSISLPAITGDVQALRWIDLKYARMTRDVSGNIFYELDGIVLQRESSPADLGWWAASGSRVGEKRAA